MRKFLFSRRSLSVGAAIAAFVALSAPAALADSASTCPAMSPAQPFLSYGDTNIYTLVPGQSPDNVDGTGWTLNGGAQLVTTTLADGSTGQVLDLPAGASATSPVMCVQSGMPLARMMTQYLGTPKNSALKFQVRNADGSALSGATNIQGLASWSLSAPVSVAPGNFQGAKQVYFTFSSNANQGDMQLYNFYVDPRWWD